MQKYSFFSDSKRIAVNIADIGAKVPPFYTLWTQEDDKNGKRLDVEPTILFAGVLRD